MCQVIHNEATGEFVLWVNRLAPAATPLASYPHATLLVAGAQQPAGPFRQQTLTLE